MTRTEQSRRLANRGQVVQQAHQDLEVRLELLGRSSQIVCREHPGGDGGHLQLPAPAEEFTELGHAASVARRVVLQPLCPRKAPVAVEDHSDVRRHLLRGQGFSPSGARRLDRQELSKTSIYSPSSGRPSGAAQPAAAWQGRLAPPLLPHRAPVERSRMAFRVGRLPRFGALDRRIVALALPALGTLLIEPVYNLTDSAIVGHLGRNPLGALAIAGGALNIVGWVAAFLEMATVSMVAFRRGAGDEPGAARAAGAAYSLSVLVGLVTAIVVAVVAPYLTEVIGGHGVVAREAVTYLRISAIGLVPLLISLAGNGHLTGLEDTKRPFVIALVANAVNVVLEITLVYGAGLGIAGSAWATVGAQSSLLCSSRSSRAGRPSVRRGRAAARYAASSSTVSA